jgi:hypothetical protein
LNRTLTGRLSMGVEVFGQTRDSAEGHGFTTLDVGLTYKLMGHWSVLASAGPTLGEHGANGQVFYTALKADY